MDGWAAEFKRRITDWLIRQGTPVSLKPRQYGWMDDNWQNLYKHLDECHPDYEACTYEDSGWSEFAGTFAEPQFQDRQGIDLCVTCACGKIAGRHWRYEGTHGDLLRGITGDTR